MSMQQAIVPCIWCDANAEEAVAFYLSVFPDSEELRRSHYPTTNLAAFQQSMAGEVLNIYFAIGGFRFTALNAGSEFRPNPMLSFIVNFDPSRDANARDELDRAWQGLTDDGDVLMPLDEYPFSKHYGWVRDKYGVSWQLMLTNPEGEPRPFIIPSLMFANANVNRGSEALAFYTSVFPDARAGTVVPWPSDQDAVKAGSIMFGEFAVGDEWFALMDSPAMHEFDFNEGLSLLVECSDQAEIDDLWGKLSHVPEAEVCGWCKDPFGVSWQVAPVNVEDFLVDTGFAAMMTMKKIIIADLV
jgi:predicted 3-demethylubiquinone-9 3-methyltransferase (glyoxalase superfamily)